jgi:hypothetical protein
MLSIQQIETLFQTSPLWSAVVILFFLNLSITLIEVIIDYFANTPRRWKDTGANIIIFIMGQKQLRYTKPYSSGARNNGKNNRQNLTKSKTTTNH